MSDIIEGGRGTRGTVTAEAVVVPGPFTFFGGVDWDTGVLTLPGDDADGLSIAGKVFVFTMLPGGQGTAWKIKEMVDKGTAPAAIVVQSVNYVLLSACVLARVPLVGDFGVDPALTFSTGRYLTVDAEAGSVGIAA